MRRFAVLSLLVFLAAAGGPEGAAHAGRKRYDRGPESPAVVLERINAATRALRSMSGASEVVLRGEGPNGLVALEAKLEFTGSPDGDQSARGQVTVRMNAYTGSFELETRTVAGIDYVKSPTTGAWEVSGEDEDTRYDRLMEEMLRGRLALEDLTLRSEDPAGVVQVLEGLVPRESLRVEIWFDSSDLRIRRMTVVGEMFDNSLGIFGGGTRAVELRAETRITAVDAPLSLAAPLALAATPLGPMRLHRAGAAPLEFPLPADWAETTPPEGVAAAYDTGGGGMLMVAEEDLAAGGLEKATLAEYAEMVKSALAEQQGFEMLSQEPVITEDGLEAILLAFQARAGLLHGYRLLYLHDGSLGLNLTFVAPADRFDQERSALRYAFGHLQRAAD